ncbi:hypothetical protein CAC42_6966 [Sphaceloma murrayae]|uniref:Calcium permeable stress-gated cation channel 1 n=1 Tax=Sphaceloma murrayae TaxID=2082308 RepID=A0A2K1QQY5_9PEZI|nr:hypothetical protein CAC42_6966 [Sphaceloma murrayae]
MAEVPAATATPGAGLGGFLDSGSGRATKSDTQSVGTLVASITTAAASFGIQFLVFIILRWRLTRIYRPKTYLVPERQRVPIPPSGPWQWIAPIFTTSNSTIISRCGLDAYYFLRFLRMLLKIFIPMALVILPILIPINRYSGSQDNRATGVNELGWPNVSPPSIRRLWAHLLLAVGSILWVCYVVYDELRGFIRIRQAYLTSPQHRIRASATTVLVSGIPRKWLTMEALSGLYDVFPGGIRNIWINRDFDELLEKVQLRDKTARQLEDAETVLIKKCVKSHKQAEAKKAKEQGHGLSRKQKKQQQELENEQADQTAQGQGTSSGDPHKTRKNIHDAVDDFDHEEEEQRHRHEKKPELDLKNPLKLMGQGLGAIGHGITALGQKSKNLVEEVADDFNQGVKTVNTTIDQANQGGGFVADDTIFETPSNTSSGRSGLPNTAPVRPRGDEPGRNDAPGLRVVRNNEFNGSTTSRRPQDISITNSSPSQGPNSSPLPSADERTSNGHPRSMDALRPLEQKTPQQHPPGMRGVASKVKAYKNKTAIPCPSPSPQAVEMDPLDNSGHAKAGETVRPQDRVAKSKWAEAWSKTQFWRKSGEEPVVVDYPQAVVQECAEDQDGEPEWKKYIEVKDRETMRLPIASWMFSLPLIGQKVDRIYHLRKELARLNAEIETDQNDHDRYPLLNSAFIQFHNQVAAHMACQSVSHHLPQHMTPRLVEISPSDVIWSNMSIRWWERYVRTGLVIAACIGLIIFFAIPVGFTGLLSQVNVLGQRYSWLAWLSDLPPTVISIIQGILPPVLLAVLLAIVPMIFRFLVQQQGVATGNDKELGVQNFYFIFLFFQVFLVVTLSSGLTNFLTNLANNTTGVLLGLARDLPKSSNYFYSYLVVQALGSSAGVLLQVGTLLFWFILGPILDSTARQKWARQTNLQTIQWGSYFPPFCNFAVIGLIFSVISPLIMLFNLVTFSLFLAVQRYNVIYVYQFRVDTGGLLFPQAINQLFTGLYVMEVALAGLFFIAQDSAGNNGAIPQGIIMIIMLAFTVIFQVLINSAFAPLLRYLPITLEDEAVVRDEEFARAQAAKFRGLLEEEPEDRESEDIEDRLEKQERMEEEADRAAEAAEREKIREKRTSRGESRSTSRHMRGGSNHRHSSMETKPTGISSWAHRARNPTDALKNFAHPRGRSTTLEKGGFTERTPAGKEVGNGNRYTVAPNRRRQQEEQRQKDIESQKLAGDVLFSGFSDELEDLTPEERDSLVRYSFQHAALRARRPVIWIPRDVLGVSDDEIARSKLMSTVAAEDSEGEKGAEADGGETKTYIWMSNEGTALDAKNRVVFRKSPPDFASVDLIAL